MMCVYMMSLHYKNKVCLHNLSLNRHVTACMFLLLSLIL